MAGGGAVNDEDFNRIADRVLTALCMTCTLALVAMVVHFLLGLPT